METENYINVLKKLISKINFIDEDDFDKIKDVLYENIIKNNKESSVLINEMDIKKENVKFNTDYYSDEDEEDIDEDDKDLYIEKELRFKSHCFKTYLENKYKTELITQDFYDLNKDKHLHMGEIYLIHNKFTNKVYIGQSQCFSGKNNNPWGTFKRWKTHIKEALDCGKDNCKILNQAIRKYGTNSFNVYMIVRVLLDELDSVEKYLIEKYNTISPNGYNIRLGGKDGKYSNKQTESKKSNTLSVLKSIELSRTPLTFDEKANKKIFMIEKAKIHKNIDPIVEKTKIIGYLVKNLVDFEGKPYPERKFDDKTNKYNLDRANKFIDLIEYFNKHNIRIKDVENMFISDRSKFMQDGYYLPEYVQIHKYYGKVKGFKINGYHCDQYSDGKFTKIFANVKKSMDENYKDTIEYLEKLNTGEIQIKKRNSTKATFNGKEVPKYLIVIYNDRETKDEIIGFRINGFPLNGREKKIHCSFTFKDYETLDEMFEEACKELERLHKLKDEQSK